MTTKTTITAGVLIAGLLGTGGYAFTQHSAAVDARATTVSVRKDLTKSKATLVDVRGDLAAANEQVATCADSASIAQHMFDSVSSLLDGYSADVWSKMDYLDDADTEIDAVTEIVDNSAYDDIDSLIEACTDGPESGI